jgi:membrane-associated phospholipid phosphatase
MKTLFQGLPFKNPVVTALFLSSGLFVALMVDEPIRSMVQAFQAPVIYTVMRRLTWAGSVLVLLALAAGLLLWGIRRKQAAVQTAGWIGIAALVVSHTVALAIKHLIGRPRPDIMDTGAIHFGPSLERGYDSFPSGHAVSAFTMAAVLASAYPRWRVIWYGAAGLVAFTRVYLDVHFVSDVAAGGILGVLVVKTVLHYHRRYQRT